MPLEIKELHIKVSVNPGAASATGGNSASQGPGNNTSSMNQEVMVQRIIDRVMEILKEKMER